MNNTNQAKKTTGQNISQEHIKAEKELVQAVSEMSKYLKRLRDLEPLQVLKHPWKLLWYSFLKGLMVGFGSVLGASLLVALFVYILTQLSQVPLIGNYFDQIITKTETNIK